jgi:hypothetical protein
MKLLISILLLLVAGRLQAQGRLVPGVHAVDKQWIKNEDSKLTWYQVDGNSRKKFGEIETTIRVDNRNVIVVTQVSIDTMPSAWIDTTIAGADDLRPIYHSSSNAWRSVVLRYNNNITGVYNDKVNNRITNINDSTIREAYFDSNLYPQLVRWLPLKEGYKQDISIYDFNTTGRSGVMKAAILNTVKGNFKGHVVWVVTVTDEISPEAMTTYYIGVNNRKLWKQEIEMGGRRMVME